MPGAGCVSTARRCVEGDLRSSQVGQRLSDMTDLESQLAAALDELEATARAMPTVSPKPSLLPLFARIDGLAAQLPPDADPELRHFLQRKSYEKARQHLRGGR